MIEAFPPEQPAAGAASGLAPGTVLDRRFAIDEEVARTPIGTWFRAHHVLFESPVALFVADAAALADPALATAFRAQAQCARCLRLHRHMARVFDVGSDGGLSFVVEEPIAGIDFARWVADADPAATATIGRHLVEALTYAHRSGVVHGGVSAGAVIVGGTPPSAVLRGFGTSLPGATARDDVQALAALLRGSLGDELDAVVAHDDAAVALERLDAWLAARVPPPEPPALMVPAPADVEPPPRVLRDPLPPPAPVAIAPSNPVAPWLALAGVVALSAYGLRLCGRETPRSQPSSPPSTVRSATTATAASTTAAPTTAAPTTAVPPTTVPPTTLPPTTTAPPTTVPPPTAPDSTAPPTTVPSVASPPTAPTDAPTAPAVGLRWEGWSPSDAGELVARVGDPVTFIVTVADGKAPVAYRWTLDGQDVSHERSWTLTPDVAQAGRMLVVHAAASDGGGGAIEREWRIRVEAARLLVRSRMPSTDTVAVAPGGTMAFSVDVTVPPSAGPLTFTWLRNGRVVATGPRPIWTLQGARSGDRRVAVTLQDGAGRTYGPYAWRVLVQEDEEPSRDDASDDDGADRDARATPEPAAPRVAERAGDRPRIVAASPGAGGIVPVRQGAALRFGVEAEGGRERGAQWWLDGIRMTRGRVCRLAATWPVGSFHHLEVEVPGRAAGHGTTVFWTLQVVPAP